MIRSNSGSRRKIKHLSLFRNTTMVRICNCQGGAVREEYCYNNVSSGKIGILYECRDQISWHYRGEHTHYHGSFARGHDTNSITLKFDCRGNTANLKTTVRLRRGEGSYAGWDYAMRWVEMTYVGASQYCEVCRAWHEM